MPAKDTSKHINGTTWGKGKSGNPGGRSPKVGPNGETLVQLCRVHTAEAVTTLKDIMLAVANEPKDRIAAALGLLDRGWGKPTESMSLDAKVEGTGVPIIQIVRVASDAADPAD